MFSCDTSSNNHVPTGPLNLLSGPQLSQVTGPVCQHDFLIYLVILMLRKKIDFGDLMDYKLQLTTFHRLIVSVVNTYNYMQI